MATTQDEPFREIQLDGKHLVFLFMAVTVLAVVIFLCGVLVGRGVRAERGLPAEGTDAAAVAAVTSGAEPPAAAPSAPASAAASSTPITAGEKLGYAERLSGSEPAAEQLQKAEPPPPAEEDPKAAAATKPEAIKPATTKTEAAKAAPVPPPARPVPAPKTSAPAPAAPAAAAVASASGGEPAGTGFAIQVAALRERSEADAIVKRLAGKGYPAYVLAPAKGAPSVFRVRVGKFKDRREADAMAARLQKEEQFKPWVVR
jgi:cell division septation protein DedD